MVKNTAKKEDCQNKKSSGFRSFFNVVIGDYDIFFANIIKFLPISVLFVCACMILKTGFVSVAESIENEVVQTVMLLVLAVLLVAAAGVFMQKWYNVVFKGEPLKKFDISLKKQVKITGLIFAFLSTLGFTAFSAVKLYNRVPTPDWKFELAYFMFFALLALAPFIAIRFSAWFAFLLNDEKLPGAKEVFAATESKMRAIIFAYIVMFVLPMLIEANTFVANDYVTSFLRCFGWSAFLALFVAETQIQKCEFFSKK